MNEVGAKPGTPNAETVRPSARDPIAEWLDVFTSLLALPPAERGRIRDELEDHLRMRVDDLLIVGMSEPEAVRKAVSELGETAELADRFKAARAHTPRRRLMHTTLFASAGLALTIGVLNLMPGAQPPVGNTPAVVDIQPEEERQNGYMDRDLPPGPLGEMLETLADAGNARLFVHWSALEPLGVTAETKVRGIPSKGLQHEKVRQLINSALGLQGLDELDVRFEGDLVEIGTVRYFDGQETIVVDYDMTLSSGHGRQRNQPQINASFNGVDIYSTIEPEIWQTGMGAVSLNGTTLTVRAPERVQAFIQEYLERLEHRSRVAEAEAREESRVRHEEQSAERERRAVEMERVISELRDRVEDFQRSYQRLSHDFWLLTLQSREAERIFETTNDEVKRLEARDQMIEAQVELEAVNIKRDRLLDQIEKGWTNIDAWESHLSSLRNSHQAENP